jgi:alpha-L-rhamnosidase
MWFVVQLQEYCDRSNDTTLVHALRPRVVELLEYFAPFENESGLLESLESWIFIEWSEANKFVQDVNYPTNMLYAATLDAAYALYGDDRWKEKANSIRDTIRAQAFNGDFFIDNAVRNERGRLEVTDNTTEVGQYYAFYFDVATPETYPQLWKRLTEQFGPGRSEQDMWPSVHPANAFIGNYLRLELLSRYGLKAQLIDESMDFFDYMARETGTLWENITPRASCNHGFASHIVHVLYRDVLGIDSIDPLRKEITLRFPEHDLASCRGQMPVGKEVIQFDWRRDGESIVYHVEVPVGYSVTTINDSGRELVRK